MADNRQRITTAWQQLLGERSQQQDACAVSPAVAFEERGCLAVLADGMGGMEDGQVFSRLTVSAMQERFQAIPSGQGLADTLLQCYLYARERALSLRSQGIDGGSTVAALLVRDGCCSFLSVGDSRIYLWRRQKLLQLNREHLLGAVLDERAALGQISREEAQNNTKRGALYNNIAQVPVRPVDRNLTPMALLPEDKLLLVSDGVYRSVADDRLSQLAGYEPEQAAVQIMQAVQDTKDPKQDNGTVVVLGMELHATVRDRSVAG